MNTKTPKVGLGMPVFNGERYLARALDSVIAQSMGDWELTIVDNASTDGTREICQRYTTIDSRIKYFRNPQNLGAHPNYNRCFEFSRGEYFKWVPHDDELAVQYLASCTARMDADPEAVLCQTDFEYIDEEGQTICFSGERLIGIDSVHRDKRFSAAILLPHTCYDVMGVFRRRVLEQTILLPSFHGSDRALLADLSLRGRFLHVDESLLRIRDHSQRYTRANTRPADRAAWHDSRNRHRYSFPTWRLYGTYWMLAWRCTEPWLLLRPLAKWWLVNWNLGRLVTDVVANLIPGAVAVAEKIKQQLFSPAPGVDRRLGKRRK